jgi:hypothetical protein
MWTVSSNGVDSSVSHVLETTVALLARIPHFSLTAALIGIGSAICVLAFQVIGNVTTDAVKKTSYKLWIRYFQRGIAESKANALLAEQAEFRLRETAAIAEAKNVALLEEIERLSRDVIYAKAIEAVNAALLTENANLIDKLATSAARSRALSAELSRLSLAYAPETAPRK